MRTIPLVRDYDVSFVVDPNRARPFAAWHVNSCELAISYHEAVISRYVIEEPDHCTAIVDPPMLANVARDINRRELAP